jgi:hypothetical protein
MRLGKKSMVGWIGAVRPSRRPLSRSPQDEEFSMLSKLYPHPEERLKGASRCAGRPARSRW